MFEGELFLSSKVYNGEKTVEFGKRRKRKQKRDYKQADMSEWR